MLTLKKVKELVEHRCTVDCTPTCVASDCAAVMPVCSTDAAIAGRKCLDCHCSSIICLAVLKTEYDDEPLSAAQRFFFFRQHSRSYKVGIVMEETEIEDYFADCFAKLSHTLARCGNEWYNHNKVYAGGRHGCFV